MNVSIIIVSYNTEDLTLACLRSIEAADGEKEIFVIDNASTDLSVKSIKESYPNVCLIENSENRGFAAANNQALKLCKGRYVIFLNPDTTIKRNTLNNAVAYMDRNPQVGLAGARILNPDGSLQESISYRYPGEKYALGETKNLKGNIACVLGAFMISPRDLIEEMEGFDEDFFLYGEDEDLAWRIREKGLSIGFIEDADVFHWGGQSEKNTPPSALFKKKLQAEFLFYSKHYRPETIERIRRAHVRKALYRMLTLRFQKLFAPHSVILNDKDKNYRLILEICRHG